MIERLPAAIDHYIDYYISNHMPVMMINTYYSNNCNHTHTS